VDPVKVLSRWFRLSQSDALKLWLSFTWKYSTGVNTQIHEVVGVLKRPHGVGDFLEAHTSYLKKRGFDIEYLKSIWSIQAIGPALKLPWRLFIPIFDERGREVSWTTRAVGNVESRYISASPEEEEIPHKTLLYGAHLAGSSIVVVEGPTDAWAIGRGCVATCGVGYSPEQFIKMSKYVHRIICFDSSDEAQERAEVLCRELSIFPGETENILLETGKDPAEADPEEIEDLRERYLMSF